jgi:5-(carboxyamino)imidazole ribonucleotide synthase
MKLSQDKTRVGILGSGQLARMIAEAALREGLQPVVLAESRDDPAAIDRALWVQGTLNDARALEELAAQSDVLTIENEFINIELIRSVLTRFPGLRMAPGLKSIALSQDKLAQKRLFATLGIPAPDHVILRPGALHRELPKLFRRFPEGFVLKFAQYGYDGRGNLLVQGSGGTPYSDIEFFCRAAERARTAIFAERLVSFSAELAIVATRTADGRIQCFPLVESRQEYGICREVVGPAVALGTPPWVASQASEIIGRIADRIGFVGTLAVEFFLTTEGKLLVNEMAPRVHNSGHYSLYGNEPSQFDLHIQAIQGQALAMPQVRGFAAMRNILGPQHTLPGLPCAAPTQQLPDGVELHWYGKRTVSAGRKMGHLTGRARTPEELRSLLESMRAYEERYWAAFSSMQQAG